MVALTCKCGKIFSFPCTRLGRTVRTHYCSKACVTTFSFADRTPRVGAQTAGYKHGLNNSPEHRSWSAMMKRCVWDSAATRRDYKDYKGRGISVCKEWYNFTSFLADMGAKPTIKHTLDRYPDKNGNYEKSNCRWATPKEQQRNTRRNVLYTLGEETMTQGDWARRLGICKAALKTRIAKWGIERALSCPNQRPGLRADYLNGENSHFAKFTTEDVLKIRELAANGVRQKDISKLFNRPQNTISVIVKRKKWKHV